MTMTTDDQALLVKQVRELARTREHRLAASQLARLDKMTPASLISMRTYLDGRPLRPDAPSPADIAAQVARATEAAQGAVSSRPLRIGPVAARHSPTKRPGERISEEGIYYYDDKIYKVIKSAYSGHWQARRLEVHTDAYGKKTGKYVFAEGMMGVLRAGDKMTPAQSRKFEELYGYPVCGDCGLPLENDLSRQRRIGPKCWVKNGHTDAELEDDPELGD